MKKKKKHKPISLIGIGETGFTKDGRGPFILTLKNIRPMAERGPPVSHTRTDRECSTGCKINFTSRVINLLMNESLEKVVSNRSIQDTRFPSISLSEQQERSGSHHAVLDPRLGSVALCLRCSALSHRLRRSVFKNPTCVSVFLVCFLTPVFLPVCLHVWALEKRETFLAPKWPWSTQRAACINCQHWGRGVDPDQSEACLSSRGALSAFASAGGSAGRFGLSHFWFVTR